MRRVGPGCAVRRVELVEDLRRAVFPGQRVGKRRDVVGGLVAVEQGVARENLTREELTRRSGEMIREARKTVETLMQTGMIPPPPKGY